MYKKMRCELKESCREFISKFLLSKCEEQHT